MEVSEEFIGGTDVNDLAKKYNIQPQTVMGYLVKFAKTGHTMPNPERFLEYSHIRSSVRKKVLNIFAENGAEYLNRAFNEMGGKVDFNELRILQLYYLLTSQKDGGK